jgi:outer membrane protein assembly factor BamA
VYPFRKNDTVSPPSITAVMGFYAENGSWGGGVLQRAYLRQDRFRFMAAAAYLDVNWDYGVQRNAQDAGGFSIPLNQKDFLTTGEFLFRLAPHLYLGPAFRYLDVRTTLRREDLPDPGTGGDPDPPAGRDFELEQTAVALGFHFEWDTRDNTFYPRSGHWMDAMGFFFRDTWGSDYDYDVYQAYYNGYRGFRGKNVLAYQLFGRFTRGDTPFFSLSSMNLRGYAFGGYMDNLMATAQVEYRREIWWRIGAVAFAGVGEVSPSWSAFSWDHLLPSYGAGLRFRLTKSNPIHLRVDMAFTEDGHHLTMFVGEAF